MFCKYCGGAVAEGAYFCPVCGKDIRATTGVPVTPQGSPFGQATTGGKAIASLICGLFIFFFPLSAVAVILGHLSLSEIRRSAGRIAGRAFPSSAMAWRRTRVLKFAVATCLAFSFQEDGFGSWQWLSLHSE